jgi:hypothetical protein
MGEKDRVSKLSENSNAAVYQGHLKCLTLCSGASMVLGKDNVYVLTQQTRQITFLP